MSNETENAPGAHGEPTAPYAPETREGPVFVRSEEALTHGATRPAPNGPATGPPRAAEPEPASPFWPGQGEDTTTVTDDTEFPLFWTEPEPLPRRRPRKGRFMAPFLAAVLGAAAGAGGTLYVADRADLFDRPAPATGGTVRVAPPVQSPGGLAANAAADVAEAVLPSIVRIDVQGAAGRGTGSGVIYRADGYIVTNNHVIAGADSIKVRLSSGESLDAVVTGTAAPAVDIAVIKVAKGGLPAATFGSTTDMRVGDLAVAIGSPFGLESTVTAGVISALHRNVTFGDLSFADAVQTDAPINPGNSGGALADAEGRVIGINTAIFSESGGNVGVGFAIPSDIARRVADDIISTGRASLPFLGIEGNSIPEDGGALIASVVPGGPADRAGLGADDVIVAIDGTTITSMEDLIANLLRHKVGDTITITYTRAGERRTAQAVLAARPGSS